MALSDIIRKIEESPRSTKIAVGTSIGAVGIAGAALAFALLNDRSEPYVPPEPAPVVQYVEVAPTASASPIPTEVPATPTAIVPSPTPGVEESSLGATTEPPTQVPEATVTPTRVSEDYYVIIKESISNKNRPIGVIEYYADFPSLKIYATETGGSFSFSNHEFLMDYLLKEGTITAEQRRDYSRGLEIKISYDDLSVAIYNLLQDKGYVGMDKDLNLVKPKIDLLLYYFDGSLLDSSSDSDASVGTDSYVVIRDGSLETVVTDADGNTTHVKIDTVNTDELLDYLLSQGKITVDQRNEYGETNSLELSLKDVKDAADFFDWAYSPDKGLSIGIDQDKLNYIRDELLPLFSFGD